jgi:hypothetical protein
MKVLRIDKEIRDCRVELTEKEANWIEERITWKTRAHSRPRMTKKEKSHNHRIPMALLI